MFLVLRIAIVVGAIFWLSPLRPPLPWDRGPPATAVEPTAAAADPGRIGRIGQAWDALSPEDRALALRTLAEVGAQLGERAPNLPHGATAAAAKPAPDKAKP